MRRPQLHLGGGGVRNFTKLWTKVDGGGRGVIF